MTATVLKQDLNTLKKEFKKNAIYYDKAQHAFFKKDAIYYDKAQHANFSSYKIAKIARSKKGNTKPMIFF